ncbi:MAG: response regulator [Endomicrobiales bacterium]|nr:response regulator [Endomicrobiales bacterium]
MADTYRILIIDDEQGILDLCKRILEQEGYFVEVSDDGYKAIDIMSESPFDLVLTDLCMPGIDGLELLRKVKATWPQTEVIIFTGQATIETAVESLKGGAFDYVLKPFNILDLLTTVHKCLEHTRLRRGEKIFRETTYFYQLAEEVAGNKTENELLSFILERMCKTLYSDSGSIYMALDDTEKLVPMAVYGGSKARAHEEIRIGERIAGWVASVRKPMLLQNGLQQYPQFKDLPIRKEVVSSMVCPLIHRETLLGIVCLTRFSYLTNYQFSDKDLESLQIFIMHATLIITAMRHRHAHAELDNLKSEFMANVSHELRTPLMAVTGAIELLNDHAKSLVETEKGKMFLDLINRNIERMRYLVNDLLDFSRMERGGLKLLVRPMDLYQAVVESIQDLSERAKEKEIKIENLMSSEKCEIQADKERIKQVLANLITNAIKFTNSGGSVKLDCKKSGDDIIISVEDSGIGIPKDKLEKVFEKFFQVDGSVSRAQAGFGIGLAIVKSVVEAHAGRAWVESESGRGSKFFVQLPIKQENVIDHSEEVQEGR